MDALCSCKARFRAMADGEFLLSFTLSAWVFTNGPMRRMTPQAAWYGSERGVDNHTGEPFRWHSCPWCGHDLPAPTTEVIWKIITGDGDE